MAALARTYAKSGARDAAHELLRDLVAAGERGRYRPSFEIAKVHLALDGRDAALDWLERAYEQRSHSMVFLEVDPQLRALHSDPRFTRLIEMVGLER